jgi:hypothetical protein
MYALTRLFSIRRQVRPAVALLMGAGACAALSGCANPFAEAKIDPQSAVAPEVAKIVHANRTYPTFASIPAIPKDVRRPQQYGNQAQVIEQARGDLEAKTAPETWSLGGTEGFAARAQSEAGPDAAPKPGGDTAAFANTQRKRATPPPPPQQ